MLRYFQLPDQSIVTELDRFTITRNVFRVVQAVTRLDDDGHERIAEPAKEIAEEQTFNFDVGWLHSASADELNRWGIVELAADARPDERSNEVSLGAVVDGRLQWVKRAREIAPLKDAATASVKAEARRVILDRVPEWKQANMLARDGELQAVQAGFMRDDAAALIPRRDLTREEAAEHLAIRRAWDWIKSVRAHSNTLEAEIAAMRDGDNVVAFKPHDWPE